MKESKIERKNMVSFRLTDGEYEPFKKIIDKMEVSRSEFFRMMVLGQTDTIPELKTKKPPEYDRLLFLFNKASNNINQLARQVNTAHKDGLLTEKKLADWYRKLSIITDNLLAGINRAG